MQNSLSDRLAQCYSGAVYDVLRERGMTDTILPHAIKGCLLYTSPSPRDQRGSRMPSSA